ncbi:hypothetical protein J8J27_28235, partial [Mycobacterium tuberculosis]|nr:hypothetical protein [Mycobacterium tuberculosis]
MSGRFSARYLRPGEPPPSMFPPAPEPPLPPSLPPSLSPAGGEVVLPAATSEVLEIADLVIEDGPVDEVPVLT